MEIRELKTFITIAETRSFTQAAQKLGYAQSSVTTQIKLLEQELGVKLFDRLGHSIALTSAGGSLLPYAEQIIMLEGEARLAAGQSQQIGGTLAIGAVESLCVARLPRILKEYRHRYPQVEITIRFGAASDFPSALQDNSVDIAFFFSKGACPGDFIAEMDIPEAFGLFAGHDHPLAALTDVYPEHLNNQAMILTERGCSYRKMLERILAEHHVTPLSVIETGNIQTIKQLAASGMGITLLPYSAVEPEYQQGKLTRLNWNGEPLEMQIQVIRHKSKWISPQLNAFIQLLREMEF